MFVDQKLVRPDSTVDTARGRFTGAKGDFFRLLLAGSLLQLPTLGFYRFWFLTDIRRHLWSNTRIGDDAFEYTGTARELLVGFLFALAVLAPIYVAYFWLGVEAERAKGFASLPLVVLLYLLGQYARFRARRYRATRTIFRGIRFWMTGSGLAYVGRVLVYDLLTLLTLGLAYPWRAAALERYLMRNTRYGNLEGRFEGTGGTLFRRAAWIWPAVLVIPILVAADIVGRAQNGSLTSPGAIIAAAIIDIAAAGLALGALLALFRAIEMKWRLQGIRFGTLCVTTDLKKRAVIGCYLKTALMMLVFLLAVAILAGFAAYELRGAWATMDHGGARTSDLIGIAASTIPAYLAVLLGFGLIKRLYLDRGLWAVAAGSITLTGVAVLDRVIAEGDVAGSFGEGLADALDFSGL